MGQLRCFGRSGPTSANAPIATYRLPAETVEKSISDQSAAQQPCSLFDHLVGAGEKRRRYVEFERLSSIEVDNQFEFRGQLHR
jgi:hypothetical protein